MSRGELDGYRHFSLEGARGFLDRPFERIEIGVLTGSPDSGFLRWLPTLPNETGLVYQRPDWFVIKASDRGVPIQTMPPYSDTLLHSHPTYPDDVDDASMPSTRDFLNASPHARNLIVSEKGITVYDPVATTAQQRQLERAIHRNDFGPGTENAYRDFLGELGLIYNVREWDTLSEDDCHRLLEKST